MHYSEIIAMFAKQSERKNMLIYNTTYQVEEGQEDNFLIWIKEFYLPEVDRKSTRLNSSHPK